MKTPILIRIFINFLYICIYHTYVCIGLKKYFFFIFQAEAIDVDIDEILDMDTDDIRRSHLIVSKFFKTHTFLKIKLPNFRKFI